MCNCQASELWVFLHDTRLQLSLSNLGLFKEDGGFTNVAPVVEKAVHQETVTPEPALSCSATPKNQSLSPAARGGCSFLDNHFSW